MLILGLHFGHDASVCVVKDGEIASYVLRERFTRVKHAATLDRTSVMMALDEAGVSISDIDFCAVSSTQVVEPIVDDGDFLRIVPEPLKGQEFNSLFYQQLRESGTDLERLRTASLVSIVYGNREDNPFQYDAWSRMYPEHKTINRESISSYYWFDTYINHQIWDEGLTLEELGSIKFDAGVKDTGFDKAFHLPATVYLDGTGIAACYIHHHMAHAAVSYYLSDFDSAAILTHDGFANGRGYHSGLFYYADGGKIFPLGPHHMALGGLYDYVGVHLGLGSTGPAGKLMGLAAYGQPKFFDHAFIGNEKNHRNLGIEFISRWIQHCEEQAHYMGYDFTHYRDNNYAIDPINADVAASTQKLFEEIRLKAVHSLYHLIRHNELRTSNLCLSGGTALNCPSNTQISSEGPFENVFVEPCCDDSGIAIGAALALYHNVLEMPRPDKQSMILPYLGCSYSKDQIINELELAEGIEYVNCDDSAKRAAQDVSEDKVICWFQGRSEAGPRALGARSIVADPRKAENWARVNEIKKREQWRPFAPAVLESEATKWFAEAPVPSPYMLFNAQVRSQQIPAVTHVDNTARIQTVTEENGNYYHLIRNFFEITGVPVVMNTSFNGPGEPIVETPADALNFFKNAEADVLYLDGFRVVRNPD